MKGNATMTVYLYTLNVITVCVERGEQEQLISSGLFCRTQFLTWPF